MKYLSINGLYKAMGFESRNKDYPQLTDHYFTGDYPVKPIDNLGDDKITQLSLLSTGSNNLTMNKVKFTEMKHGTKEDYLLYKHEKVRRRNC